jgi:MFS family permease
MVGRIEPAVTDDAYASLRIPAVRRYIAGRTFALLGRQMLGVSIGWQIYDRTNSSLALGLVGLVQIVPVVALALRAGDIVDRRNRRDLAIAANLAVVACAAALAAISHARAPVWSIYATLLALGVATAFEAPATGALMAQLVPVEHFGNANAWRSTTAQLAATVGPALAGALIAWRGNATAVYAIDALLGLGFSGVLASLRRPATPAPRSTAPVREELRAGLRLVFATELLLSAITLDLFAVLLGGATALLPVFARDVLHVGASGLGWLRAAPSMGALAMALVTTQLPPWRHAGRVLLITVAGFGLATLGFGLSSSFALSMVFLAATGVFDNVSVVIRLTLEQLVTPDRLRGRVSAVHYVFIGLSNEMGEFESGATAALLGPVGSVVLGGVGTLVVAALVAWRWPALRRLGALADLRAVDPDEQPAKRSAP